jgi:hypothetical protein
MDLRARRIRLAYPREPLSYVWDNMARSGLLNDLPSKEDVVMKLRLDVERLQRDYLLTWLYHTWKLCYKHNYLTGYAGAWVTGKSLKINLFVFT